MEHPVRKRIYVCLTQGCLKEYKREKFVQMHCAKCCNDEKRYKQIFSDPGYYTADNPTRFGNIKDLVESIREVDTGDSSEAPPIAAPLDQSGPALSGYGTREIFERHGPHSAFEMPAQLYQAPYSHRYLGGLPFNNYVGADINYAPYQQQLDHAQAPAGRIPATSSRFQANGSSDPDPHDAPFWPRGAPNIPMPTVNPANRVPYDMPGQAASTSAREDASFSAFQSDWEDLKNPSFPPTQ